LVFHCGLVIKEEIVRENGIGGMEISYKLQVINWWINWNNENFKIMEIIFFE